MAMDSLQALPLDGTPKATSQRGHVPGEVGIWIFVLADMLLEFATIFGYFLYERYTQPAVFAQSKATLSLSLGLTNTLLLLTSSMWVALAVQALRGGDRDKAASLFVWARLLGLAFIAVKVIEYGGKFSMGFTPMTNPFYMYYFAATGLHLMHVVIGLVMLAYVTKSARSNQPRPNELRSAEVAATFWHMVDLVWVVLFPLLYLVP